jgi:UDPglucose--hexose-1-phosphate uridylyltransferase
MDSRLLTEIPHRRLNPLTGEWVLVSPHRTDRPWQGQIEQVTVSPPVDYDPGCYLCPGNARAGGHRNPDYESTFVFDNDFPALMPDIPEAVFDDSDLLTARSERGVSRVVCFSPHHGLTIGRMDVPAVGKIVDTWVAQHVEIGALPFVDYVQIFENRGEMMGCSNPHPHSQIWAAQTTPNEMVKEDLRQREWSERHNQCLLCECLSLERRYGARIVCENSSFVALVPFWAVWPFEILLVSTRHMGSIDELTLSDREELSRILRGVATRYDNLFAAPFPYTMGFHCRPTDSVSRPWFHFHAHYYPPLLRSATVRKFMVGFEMLGTPQRDITPESAAGCLRQLDEVHYLDRG